MRKFLNAGLIAASFVSGSALASTVAIVDSGTWFGHELLKDQAWVNPNEIAGNHVDDDRNGKVDDVVGWNFVDGYSQVFVPDHLAGIHPDIYQLFALLAKIELGTMTPADKAWWIEHVQNLPEPEKQKLLAQANYYGQYAHGTHCSGIVAQGNDAARILAARVFADQAPPEMHRPVSSLWEFPQKSVGGWVREQAYKFLATNVNKPFVDVANYLAAKQAGVANYSLGVPVSNLAKQILALMGKKNPTEQEIRDETARAYRVFDAAGRKWMGVAKDTLFVLAAGNEGQDNEVLPMFPASIAVENAITVAATNGTQSLARFSNYGAEHVQVAAPGVAVLSSVPGPTTDFMLPMSGTSMAAPYVTMVASGIKDRNPVLTPAQVRRILMETVDHKDWLVGKVATAGLVNADRAFAAAEASVATGLDEAIATAREQVADQPEEAALHPEQGPVVSPTLEMQDWARRLRF